MADTQKETNPEKYPGFTGVGYPEVFTTIPPQPTEKKPGQLPPEKVIEYFDQGYVVAENFFSLDEIEPCRESYRQLVDEIAQKLYKSGRVKNLYEDYGLENRLVMLEKEWPGAVMLLLKLGKLTPAFRAMYGNEKLLNALEQLLGPDDGASPVWNTRPKTPGHRETHVKWHQDAAYFDRDAYNTMIITAWIAFVDTTEEKWMHGGLISVFVRGGHKKGLVVVHTVADNFYLVIDDDELVNRLGVDPAKDFVKCPVKAGSVIFFSNLTPHRSVPNCSDHIRWAMDLRYQNPKRPWGYHGLKKGITLRSSDDPNIKPDWDTFNSQDRYEVQKDYEIKKLGHGQKDEFDTIITAPHMDMWKITERNKHVDQYFDEKAKEN